MLLWEGRDPGPPVGRENLETELKQVADDFINPAYVM